LIGVIPSTNKTYEVEGYFDSDNLVEGKLYISPDNRLYVYSLTETRSSPKYSYFPIWDGSKKYTTPFSNTKYLADVTLTDVTLMCSKIDKQIADSVLYQQRRCDNDDILEPLFTDGDNMFTQCVKGVLNAKKYTLIDLVDMSTPKLSEKAIWNYYTALTKISFMRLDKWNIWVDNILHVNYNVIVTKDSRKLLSFHYPKNTFDTGIVKYDNIIDTKDDPFKKIIKILMVMENINKNDLRSKEIDDYTINNMLTILNSSRSLSAQLFSRFIRMAGLSYEVNVFEKDNLIFEYKES